LLAGASASNVLDLVPDNFDSVIGNGKPGLVEFFAPWCGHCKNLAPIYEQLADAFTHAKDKVIIAKVDADGEGRPLGQKYDVNGFPTLKWFDAEGNVENYDGGRDLDALVSFVTTKSGVKSNIKPPPPPATLILDARTFDKVALDETKDVLVTFTSPWCGHCKNLKPIYEEVAKDFQPESNCIVADFDATPATHRDISERYEVKAYPTIKFFPRGGKEVENYEGARSEEAFVTFLNERCGTQRAVGGDLHHEAGRLAELDSVVQKFLSATGDARNAIYKEAKAVSESLGATSKHYLRVMEKIVNTSEAYIEKESQRLASILSKRTLAQSKLDEIKIKSNILKAFILEKSEAVIGRKADEL